MFFLKNEKGLSLVELVVGMTLMVLILAAVVPLFATMLKTNTTGMSNNNLMEEGRWAISAMTQDINCASAIVSPGSQTVTSSTLTVQQWQSPGTITVTYSIVNNSNGNPELCRQVGAGTNSPLTDGNRVNVSSINFATGENNENVTITLTLTNANNQSETVSSTIFLLNQSQG